MNLDLFAGPGGWTVGGGMLGMSEIGIEWDAAACATRRAAGHLTVRADVSVYPTAPFVGTIAGLIASPPCQAFSVAGAGKGRDLVPDLLDAINARDWSARPDPDPKVWLVLEVGRWFDALRPEWIALEQVPSVLPMWRAYAELLRAAGYSVWTGELNAADLGVPQTRRRAILLASRVRSVTPPTPTHGENPTLGLFGTLKPWVTMADALGWGMTSRPGYALAVGTGAGGGIDPAGVGGSGARRGLYANRAGGRWVLNTGRDWKPGGDRSDAQRIPIASSAPALTAKSGGQWMFTRPATTVAFDPRVWPPGHKINGDDAARLGQEEAERRYGDRAGTEAIRITVPDALVLQSFPPDYPVQGTKTKAFEQIGNAIPPLLARACLEAVI